MLLIPGGTHAGAVATSQPRRPALRRSLQSVAHRARGALELVAPPSVHSTPLEQCLHVAVLCLTTKTALESVRTDQWGAIRSAVRGRLQHPRDRRRTTRPSPPPTHAPAQGRRHSERSNIQTSNTRGEGGEFVGHWLHAADRVPRGHDAEEPAAVHQVKVSATAASAAISLATCRGRGAWPTAACGRAALGGLTAPWPRSEPPRRYVFNPSLGYAAGATLAASFAKREWLSCIMVGWGFGGAYFGAFRVEPPE